MGTYWNCLTTAIPISTVNVLNFEHFTLQVLVYILIFMQLFLKIFSGMANSVDPDQTAPSGAV